MMGGYGDQMMGMGMMPGDVMGGVDQFAMGMDMQMQMMGQGPMMGYDSMGMQMGAINNNPMALMNSMGMDPMAMGDMAGMMQMGMDMGMDPNYMLNDPMGAMQMGQEMLAQGNMIDNFGVEMSGMMGMDPMMGDPMMGGYGDPMMNDPMMGGYYGDPMMNSEPIMGSFNDPYSMNQQQELQNMVQISEFVSQDVIFNNPDPFETDPGKQVFSNSGEWVNYMINGPKTLVGSNFGETLYGAPLGHDYIHGMGGNDNIYPDDYDDIIGWGSDIVFGGDGSDLVYAGDGNDRIYGDNGVGNSQNGNSNADYLYGESGNDFMYGGEGRDSLYGGIGSDTFVLQLGMGETVQANGDAPGVTQNEQSTVTLVMDYHFSSGDRLLYTDNTNADVSSPSFAGLSNPMSNEEIGLESFNNIYTDVYNSNAYTTFAVNNGNGSYDVVAHVYNISHTFSDSDFVTIA